MIDISQYFVVFTYRIEKILKIVQIEFKIRRLLFDLNFRFRFQNSVSAKKHKKLRLSFQIENKPYLRYYLLLM